MPKAYMAKFLHQVSGPAPGQILGSLERVSSVFDVSVESFVVRAGKVRVRGHAPFILLSLRYTGNRHNRRDVQLRVNAFSSVFGLREFFIWKNRTAKGINFKSAQKLFHLWRETLSAEGSPSGGKYVLAADGTLARGSVDSPPEWTTEEINISYSAGSGWQKGPFRMFTGSRLCAAKGSNERGAYIVSVLRPA